MTDTSLEERWLVDRFPAAGYIVIIISAYFDGRGATRSYNFSCPPDLRGRRILPLVEAYSISGAFGPPP